MDVELNERHKAGNALIGRLLTELDLLGRHVRLLQEVQKGGPMGILRLGEAVEQPAHRVRYSLRLLEEANLIEATTAGAKGAADLDTAVTSIAVSLEKAAADLDYIRSEVTRLQEAIVQEP